MRNLAGSDSQIAWRMCGNDRPNCINYGAIYLSVVPFTLGIPLSGCSGRFRIRHGRSCAWVTAAMREILSLSPNFRTVSAAGKRMLKPSCTLRCIPPRVNPTISGVHSDARGPFFVALSRASLYQGGHVQTSIPSSTYNCRRAAARWKTAAVSVPNLPHLCKAIKARK